MIVRRIVFIAAAVGLIIAAAMLAVFSLGFAVYAALRDALTPAGAAAVVVLLAAVVLGGGAFLLISMAKLPKAKAPRARARAAAARSPVDRVMDMARERPFVAAGVAAAAGLLALVNPKVVTAALRAFTTPADDVD